MIYAFNIAFSDNLEDAPYQENLLLLLSDGTVHSAKKIQVSWVRYPDRANEERGERDEWLPIGVSATYSAEVYFEQDVVGWAK